MMKYFVLVAIPIAFTLSITNTVNAEIKTIELTSTNESTERTKSYFLASNNISKEDLRGINQAIIEYYKQMNKDIKSYIASGSIDLFEVKKIKIIEFNAERGEAVFQTEEVRRSSSFDISNRIGQPQRKWDGKLEIKSVKRQLTVVKENGKWRVKSNYNGNIGLL
jgi:hypothetical protein